MGDKHRIGGQAMVAIDFNKQCERRWFFTELGRFCAHRPGVEALHRGWRHDRARLRALARTR